MSYQSVPQKIHPATATGTTQDAPTPTFRYLEWQRVTLQTDTEVDKYRQGLLHCKRLVTPTYFIWGCDYNFAKYKFNTTLMLSTNKHPSGQICICINSCFKTYSW